MRRLKNLLHLMPIQINHQPIFILGLEKSGTTAIAALLARYSNLSVTLDIPELWGQNIVQIYNNQIHFLDFACKHKVYFSRNIIKEPNMTFIYSRIKEDFPKARFIMIVRDPRQVIRSILNRLDIDGKLTNLPSDSQASLPRGWRYVFDSSWLGINGQTYIEVIAKRWDCAADIYLEHKSDMLLVRYENFMDDKVGMIGYIAQELGLVCKQDIREYVNVQYQPRGNRSISLIDFFGLSNLEYIERICGNRMTLFDYKPLLSHNVKNEPFI